MNRRVLQVLGRSAGGIARHVAQVTEALDGRDGLQIDIACPPGIPLPMPKTPMLVEIPDGPRGHRAARRTLRRVMEQGGYDVVHAHGLRAGIDACRAAPPATFKLATVHNLVHPAVAGRKARLYALAHPLLVRAADRTLAVSAEIARALGEGPSVEVLYLGIGDAPQVRRTRSEVRAELGVGDEPLAVSVARLSAQKALDVLLDAFALVPGARLVVVGEGPLRERLAAHARTLGIDGRVSFVGFRDDVADIVAAADVFCLSSVWEGVPLAVQEAILLGVPVVGTDVGGMPEIVTDGRSGRLVPPGDPPALAGALREVLGDPERAASFAERARADLRERFSTGRMLARLTELYMRGAGAV